MNIKYLSIAFAITSIFSLSASCENFSSTNIQFLYGNSIQEVASVDTVPDGNVQTITLEHFSTWEYGANFFFVDMEKADYGNNGYPGVKDTSKTYGEWAPSLSFSKMSGTDVSFGCVKDVMLAGQINRGKNFEAELLGLGVMLDVPYFNFVEVDLYTRDDNFNKRTQQLTIAWNSTFELGVPLIFEGFIDYYGVDVGTVFLTQPRLLLDGKFFGEKTKNLQIGIEYYYYKTSAVPGFKAKVVESAPQIMVKWIF